MNTQALSSIQSKLKNNTISPDDIKKLSIQINHQIRHAKLSFQNESLEEVAERLANSEKQSLFSIDPGSELSLAALARIVVALIRGNALSTTEAFEQLANPKLNNYDLESLLSARKLYI